MAPHSRALLQAIWRFAPVPRGLSYPATAGDPVRNKFCPILPFLEFEDSCLANIRSSFPIRSIYSSLSYLWKLPFNTLKIDRSFVMVMTEDSKVRLIVKSILNLASGLGLEVVAEGVETAEQSRHYGNLSVR